MTKSLNLNSIRFIVHTLSKLFISQCNIWIKKWTGSVMYINPYSLLL